MLAVHIDGVFGRGEVLVRKSTDRNGVKRVVGQGMIPERAATYLAEMEIGCVAAVSDVAVEFVLAADCHRVGRKPRLHRKGRATAFLAIITMADRDADGFAGAHGGKLAATAGGGAGVGHFPTKPKRSCIL